MSARLLKSPAVSLIPYGQQHDAKTVEWLNNPGIRQTFGISRPVTPASHRAWIDSVRETLTWAMMVDGMHCGNVLLHCNPRHRSAYFQVYIGVAAMRARGIGRAVLNLVLEHAFTDLDLNRVWLHTFPENAAAERLYASAGFVKEGVERESVLRNGAFCSQRRWSLLAREWRSRTAERRQ